MSLPENFTSIQAKMNKNMKFAIEQMNLALEAICKDTNVSASAKFKVTTEYLSLYMRLENEKMKEAEHKEVLAHKKLSNKLKRIEVQEADGTNDGIRDITSSRANFSSKMV